MHVEWPEIIEFWFGPPGHPGYAEPRDEWFEKSTDFDAEVRERFLGTWVAAGKHQLDHWLAVPDGALALVVVLDQFPRNMFRSSAKAYITDRQALAVAERIVDRGWDQEMKPGQRWFVYLPFEHSESMAVQERSIALFRGLAGDKGSRAAIEFARRHYDIIARFGRFPHRNGVLGRDSTPEELEFLRQPGSGF
jgi:uncharacterized protein (DUF924 family)